MQLNIGQVLAELDCFDENKPIEFLMVQDLIGKMTGGEVIPRYLTGNFGSYRGYYNDLHVSYDYRDKGKNTVADLKKVFHDALAQGLMWGYKGGEYDINPNTKVWLAEYYGDCSNLYFASIQEVNGVVTVLLEEDRW